jgi:FtsH-binding integral membrane protein
MAPDPPRIPRIPRRIAAIGMLSLYLAFISLFISLLYLPKDILALLSSRVIYPMA